MKEKLLKASLAYMQSHMQEVTAEIASMLTDEELFSLLDSDDTELDSEMQIFDIIKQRAAHLSSLHQASNIEPLLKVCFCDFSPTVS